MASPCSLVLFYRCLDYILEEIKHNRKANVMVASHNEDTVKFTLRRWVLGRQHGVAGTGGLRDGGAEQSCGENVLWLVRSLCSPGGILAPF